MRGTQRWSRAALATSAALAVLVAIPSVAAAGHVQSSLTVVKTPPEGGTVTGEFAGIDCGTDCTETYGHYVICEYDLGFENCYDGWGGALLRAAPAPGYVFEAWEGCTELRYDDCNAVVWPGEGDLTVTARFRRAEPNEPVPPGPLVPPPVTVTPASIGVTRDPTPTVEFSSTEPGVKYTCWTIATRPDGTNESIREAISDCRSPYTTPYLEDGTWRIEIHGINAAQRAVTEVERPLTVATAPNAHVAFGCTGTVCFFNGFGSSDAGGSIADYRWDFGDDDSAAGGYVRKTFASYGTYSARLTVTDHDGASASRQESFTLLRLTGRVSLAGGFPTVELSWNAKPKMLYWMYRGSKRVGIVYGSSIVDRPPPAASGAYSYMVCEATGGMCSALETLSAPLLPGASMRR
jgi:hypothetical protein